MLYPFSCGGTCDFPVDQVLRVLSSTHTFSNAHVCGMNLLQARWVNCQSAFCRSAFCSSTNHRTLVIEFPW